MKVEQAAAVVRPSDDPLSPQGTQRSLAVVGGHNKTLRQHNTLPYQHMHQHHSNTMKNAAAAAAAPTEPTGIRPPLPAEDSPSARPRDRHDRAGRVRGASAEAVGVAAGVLRGRARAAGGEHKPRRFGRGERLERARIHNNFSGRHTVARELDELHCSGCKA